MTRHAAYGAERKDMTIRKAKESDIGGINRLLREVLEIHAKLRPDLFVTGTKKYTDEQLAGIINCDATPIFVAAGDDGSVLGYCFCEIEDHEAGNCTRAYKTLYIDDLCVDEEARGSRVGRSLYEHALDFARGQGCHSVTLNVWEGNDGARAFYEKMGMGVRKTMMETVLDR